MRRLIPSIAALSLALVMVPDAAHAGPVVAAIGAIVSTITTAIAALGPIGSLIVRLVVSAAASALLRALAPKPREPGIKTEVTQSGGTNPCSFILLRYATGGTRVCPPMSHGTVGETPNAYLTEVIELGDIRGQVLHRVIMNDEEVTLGAVPHPDYGLPVQGRYTGFAWVRYYDGTQTAADPMLLARYGTYPERPWSADMIGRGLCYAIVTFRYNRKLWGSAVPPRLRFEVGGIPLYDPRLDSTVGGVGPHRWANRESWAPSTNPMVAIYNIMRGITFDTGDVWGAGIPAADLPLAAWFTAMNECDVLVGNGSGGTEPQYRAGFEVTVDEEPADVIAELLKACSGQLAEIGGVWKPRVGAVGLPVMSFTDGDLVITKEQTYAPFPNFTSSYNGIHAIYPEPAMLWEQKEAPPLYNATWEAEDQGQRLIANLGLPSVPYGAQVRRIMAAYIADERRFRRHGLTLPPDASVLEPLDAVAWTSVRNGYVGKVFEIPELVEDPHTCLIELALRERDPSDYVSTNPSPPAVTSTLTVIPPDQTVPNFAVVGVSILDATGAARRPALSLTWQPDLDDVRGIMWEARLQATGVVVARGSTQNVAAGTLLISQGILAATAYQVRAQPVLDRPSAWTAWVSATTPDTLLISADLAVGSVTEQYQTVVLGPFTVEATPPGTVLATVDMGPVPPGVIWQRCLQFRARVLLWEFDNYEVQLQIRWRIGDGPFTEWAAIRFWTAAQVGASGVADSYQISGQADLLFGYFSDVEYRVIVIAPPILVPPNYEWISEIYLTLTRVTK